MSENQLLSRFRDEVLYAGPESTLPGNLDDFWLAELSRSLEQFFDREDSEDEEGKVLSLPLAAVVHILFVKNGGNEIKESMDTIFDHMQSYRVELALEEVRRKTDVKADPVTLESIFTNRNVTFEKATPRGFSR